MTVAQSKKIKGMTVFNTEKVDTKTQPMFFGAPLGVQRYDSYKYLVFDKLTTQIGNTLKFFVGEYIGGEE